MAVAFEAAPGNRAPPAREARTRSVRFQEPATPHGRGRISASPVVEASQVTMKMSKVRVLHTVAAVLCSLTFVLLLIPLISDLTEGSARHTTRILLAGTGRALFFGVIAIRFWVRRSKLPKA